MSQWILRSLKKHNGYTTQTCQPFGEMTVENRSAGTAVGGIPQHLVITPTKSNIPEQATGGGSQRDATVSMHREATRNYELTIPLAIRAVKAGQLSVIERVGYGISR